MHQTLMQDLAGRLEDQRGSFSNNRVCTPANMTDEGWTPEAIAEARRVGTESILFFAGESEISDFRLRCTPKVYDPDSELPEDDGPRETVFSKLLIVCLSSTVKEENHPGYDIVARIKAEREKRIEEGEAAAEVVEALIPAILFLTTNTNESSRTFDGFFRLVLNMAEERKGNIYGVACRQTLRVSAKSMKQREGRVDRLTPGSVIHILWDPHDRDAHSIMKQVGW